MAGVYADGTRLPGPDKLPAQTPVQVSEIVTFAREHRLFVLDGEVRTASRYAVFADSYAADPDRVLDVMPAAAHPAWETAECDLHFVRPA
ncbi:hypothetical protein ABH935_009259 [Catenulispora sp. GAS73]|uniref:ATP-grasp domain-containing protein n=1 Tax=Catenulispora sp. GAS73 TaxID=3156269 RepID=UPI003513BBEA